MNSTILPPRGRIGTGDLLVLTSSDQLLSLLKTFIFLFTKQGIIIRRSTVLTLLLQKGFPDYPTDDLQS